MTGSYHFMAFRRVFDGLDRMDLQPERISPRCPWPAGEPISEAWRTVAGLLLGEALEGAELPRLADLTAAVTSLARGTRAKVLLPLTETPAEFALMRRGDQILVSYYETGAAPDVHVLDRCVDVDTLVRACGRASLDAAGAVADPTERQIALRLGERALRVDVSAGRTANVRAVTRRGGALDEPGSEIPLAFGFEAAIKPGGSGTAAPSVQADMHALLFEGTLWAFVRGRRVHLARGPIMLAAQRMVVAVRSLVDAWDAGRPANVRLRSGRFGIGVRLERSGEVSITVGTDDVGAVTAAALDVPEASLPILRLTSDLLRALVGVDRTQTRNLKVRALRDEVRSLRKRIRAHSRDDGFVNRDPDRLRASAPPRAAAPATTHTVVSRASALRFSERWRLEVDGLDATSTFFCGDRLVLATPRLTLAVDRDDGSVLWARDGAGTTSMMAGEALLRISPEGLVELCSVHDGEPYARTRIAPRVGAPRTGLHAGGGAIPPLAILTEGGGRLVAIDLRTGEPRWRFAPRGEGRLALFRAGRVLLAVCGDGAVHALDVTSGEVVWRFTDRGRFVVRPAVCRDTVLAAAGEPGGQAGTLYGIDLYSGSLEWRQPLDAAPAASLVSASSFGAVAMGHGSAHCLAAFEPRTGSLRWMIPDPGVALGAASMTVDDTLIVNAPTGRLCAIDSQTGATRWARTLSDPVADDVPRRLDPVLRGGALFVPAASVHVARPTDGAPLGDTLPCDLVPDVMRVDERGWVFVAEESGHVAAYAPAPQLRVIRGGG